MIDFKLLKKISETPGAPGFERPIRELIKKELNGFADSMEVDNLGNLIVKKNGKSAEKRVMVAAHMDEIGFMVSYIDDQGFVHLRHLVVLILKHSLPSV